MNIADRIQTLRKEKGISQEELADRIGVSRQAVSKWESGQSTPDIEKIILLSDYFETTTDYLLKGIIPVKETETKWNALICTIAGTEINVVGLIVAVVIWIERQNVFAVGAGLIFMALGIMLFSIGQAVDHRNRQMAKRYFVMINVWVLLLIPMSCAFNLLNGLRSGTWWQITPVPVASRLERFLFWTVYIVICGTIDILFYFSKKQRSRAD